MARAQLSGRGVFDLMRAASLVVLAFLLASPLVLAQPLQTYWWMPAQGEPSPEFGPDVPTTPFPIATVVAFENESWAWDQGPRTHAIAVPSGWSRVVLEWHQRPDGDPWDRGFSAWIGGMEVLRGTTPRTDFTVTKDVTRYAALLPQGGTATVTADTSAWDVGPQFVTVTLRFYDDETRALVEAAHDHAIPVYTEGGLCKDSVITRTVTFPDAPSARGTLEFFATNHGREEGYMMSRHFDVLVDGQPLSTVYTFPYRYAWVGVYGGNDDVHPVVWWSAFRALDVAGVHTGPGEIPPYRLELDASQLAMLSGTHEVSVHARSVYNCVWITSLNILLDEA